MLQGWCTMYSTVTVLPRGSAVEQSMGAIERIGIGLSYLPARLLRLAKSIPWNQFLGSLKVYKYCLRTVLGSADQQYGELYGSAKDIEEFLALAFMPNKITRNCLLNGAVCSIFFIAKMPWYL